MHRERNAAADIIRYLKDKIYAAYTAYQNKISRSIKIIIRANISKYPSAVKVDRGSNSERNPCFEHQSIH